MISEVCQRHLTPEDHNRCPVLVNDENCQCSCHPNTVKDDQDKESAEQIKIQEEKKAGLSEIGSNISNIH